MAGRKAAAKKRGAKRVAVTRRTAPAPGTTKSEPLERPQLQDVPRAAPARLAEMPAVGSAKRQKPARVVVEAEQTARRDVDGTRVR